MNTINDITRQSTISSSQTQSNTSKYRGIKPFLSKLSSELLNFVSSVVHGISKRLPSIKEVGANSVSQKEKINPLSDNQFVLSLMEIHMQIVQTESKMSEGLGHKVPQSFHMKSSIVKMVSSFNDLSIKEALDRICLLLDNNGQISEDRRLEEFDVYVEGFAQHPNSREIFKTPTLQRLNEHLTKECDMQGKQKHTDIRNKFPVSIS